MTDVTSKSKQAKALSVDHCPIRGSDWNYDFTSLPHWDVRDKIPYVYDLLFENGPMDLAFLIYSIVEYRMCSYAGYLAILQNKKKPELMFWTEKPVFSNAEVMFSRDGQLAFAQSAFWNDGGWPIYVFDLPNRRFARFKTITKNICYTVKEIEPNEFVIVADEWQMRNDELLQKINGTKIEIKALKWRPLGNIDSFWARFEKSYPSLSLIHRIRKFLFG